MIMKKKTVRKSVSKKKAVKASKPKGAAVSSKALAALDALDHWYTGYAGSDRSRLLTERVRPYIEEQRGGK